MPTDTPQKDEENSLTTTNPSAEDCSCDPALIDWENSESWYDEHAHIVPGTCRGCGERRYFQYNETGIRDDEGTYLHEF